MMTENTDAEYVEALLPLDQVVQQGTITAALVETTFGGGAL